ncbi:NAD(P)H-dependent oxidoreductase [Loktanella sp. DJP18]|uniref:NAD(P)H-dependent oxidoreductase n=1 Tax=Loktanella sp. DJP18 TaxID=3409788 RepID=UPI003BB5D15E
MTRTLILVFHPDLTQSRANAALAKAATTIPGVEVIDMQAAFPDGLDMARDGAAEAARLLTADRIVLQFPVQWYSAPPLLKAWQNAVLTRMFYIHFEDEGRQLAGTPLMLAATAGNVPEAYSPEGSNGFPMTDLFMPLRAMAHRCAFDWAEPFVLYNAMKMSEEAFQAAGNDYATTLARWIATPQRRAA